jgi:hypothetical protein
MPKLKGQTFFNDQAVGDTDGLNHFEHGTPNLSPIGGYK